MASCERAHCGSSLSHMATADCKTAGYEAPSLTVLGTLHGLTEDTDKKLGGSDGFTFLGQPITNNS